MLIWKKVIRTDMAGFEIDVPLVGDNVPLS